MYWLLYIDDHFGGPGTETPSPSVDWFDVFVIISIILIVAMLAFKFGKMMKEMEYMKKKISDDE